MSDRRGKKIEPISEDVLLERQFRLKNNILREVRALLRQLKQKKGLTQSAIAQRCDMDPAEVSRVLNGQVNITLATLSDLLEGMEAELQVKAVPVDQFEVLSTERTTSEETSTQWSGLTSELEGSFIRLEAMDVDCQTFFVGNIAPPFNAPLAHAGSVGNKYGWIVEASRRFELSEVADQRIQLSGNEKMDYLEEVV